MAAEADKLWAFHNHEQPGTVAAVAVPFNGEDEQL
jgi:hypothetical protein